MILPNFATLAAIKAVKEVLGEIKRSGSVAGILDRWRRSRNTPMRRGFRTSRRSRRNWRTGPEPDVRIADCGRILPTFREALGDRQVCQ